MKKIRVLVTTLVISLCIILFAPVIKAAQTVFISGVDCGVCVVPDVYLWSKPGGGWGATPVTTVNGCSGIPVRVKETRYVNGVLWYHVETFGVNAGKSGWVIDSFIK